MSKSTTKKPKTIFDIKKILKKRKVSDFIEPSELKKLKEAK